MEATLSNTDLKIARQFLGPNTRLEVDRALNLNIPLNPALDIVVRELLRAYHAGAKHVEPE